MVALFVILIVALMVVAAATGSFAPGSGDGMLTLRRLYVYFVAAASIGFLVKGVTGAGATVIELLLGGGALQSTYRQSVALSGAEIIVALPLWVGHWRFAQRLAQRDPNERRAGLRSLYLYGVLAGLLLTFGVLLDDLIGSALGLLLGLQSGSGEATWVGLARRLWELVVVVAFLAYTHRITSGDRAAVGESGAGATLRRWYVYGAQLVALLIGLSGTAGLLREIAVDLLSRATFIGAGQTLVAGVAQTAVAVAVWVFLRRLSSDAAVAAEDRQSTLRAICGFLTVAVAVSVSLFNLGVILHWSLSRLVGVAQPSGLAGDAVPALAGPVAACIVFGAAWALGRRDLARDASMLGMTRQAAIGRLYQHLVAAVSLATFASGLGLLLWTLTDQFLGSGTTIAAMDFRDEISLGVTLVVVGLPVWLLFWRPVGTVDDRLGLSRRLYLFASLLASVLVGLGAGVWLVSLLLRMLFAVPGPAPEVQLGHSLGLFLVALVVGAYHGRVLRQDMALRGHSPQSAAEPESREPADMRVPAPIAVEITGATEEEVRRIMDGLPAGASYEFRSR